MIWTLTIIGILAAVILLGGLLARRAIAKRRRSANWNDLHERGKLITSQLVYLHGVNARRSAPGNAEPLKEPLPQASAIDPAEATPSADSR